MADDGIDAEQRDDGMWRWTWQSPGGAFHLGRYDYRSKASAKRAGRTWLEEFVQQ